MKYFLDSAKIDEIEEAYSTFGIEGVTTNPRHIQASGKPFLRAVEDIAAWVVDKGLSGREHFPVSVEIDPHLTECGDIVAAAREIAALSKNFVVKVPCIPGGVAASRILEKEGVRTNLTLVFSPAQALFAGRNGCLFVSPFVGWKEDGGEDGLAYLTDIVETYKNYGWYGKTQIIAAAVRSPRQIAVCAKTGCDIVTAGLAVYKSAMHHAYTDQGIRVFTDAWDNTAKG